MAGPIGLENLSGIQAATAGSDGGEAYAKLLAYMTMSVMIIVAVIMAMLTSLSYFVYCLAASHAYGKSLCEACSGCGWSGSLIAFPKSLCDWQCWVNCCLPFREVELLDAAGKIDSGRPSVSQVPPSKWVIHASFWLYVIFHLIHGLYKVLCSTAKTSSVVIICIFGVVSAIVFMYVRVLVGAYASERAGVELAKFSSVCSFASWFCCGGIMWTGAIRQACKDKRTLLVGTIVEITKPLV